MSVQYDLLIGNVDKGIRGRCFVCKEGIVDEPIYISMGIEVCSEKCEKNFDKKPLRSDYNEIVTSGPW